MRYSLFYFLKTQVKKTDKKMFAILNCYKLWLFIAWHCFSCVLLDETHNDVKSIGDHINANKTNNETIFAFKDFQKLFVDLNFVNCSNDSSNMTTCNMCITPEEFLHWYDYNTSSVLSEKEFRAVSPGLLYILIPSTNTSVVCKTFNNTHLPILPSTNLFTVFRDQYGDQHDELEKILDSVNTSSGKFLTEKPCFSANDALLSIVGSNKEIVDQERLEQVSVFVILKLLRKHCIKDHDSKANKTYFMDEIFSKFNNVSYMSRQNFEDLVKKFNFTQRSSVSKCFTAKEMLDVFHDSETSPIDRETFKELGVALVQQVVSGACSMQRNATQCVSENVNPDSGEHKTEGSSSWKPWIGAMLATLIICGFSCVGVLTAPFADRKWFPFLMMFVIALGISALIGDAMLHLLPASLGLHGDHSDHSEHEENEILKTDSYLWKMVMFLCGIYVFFLFEIFMHAYGSGAHGHSHDSDALDNLNDHHKHAGRPVSVSNDSTAVQHDKVIENISDGYPREEETAIKKRKALEVKKFKSVVWMIFIGDGIHNFFDGVAVGAAFSGEWPDALLVGISTSIAILCHELPHELGDFAILLSSGLSIKQTLWLNLVSSLTAFAGVIVGVLIGTELNATSWIFAIIVGLFVYIALGDMLPELLHCKELKTHRWQSILCQSSGLLCGFVIMFLIAVYEEKLTFQEPEHA